MSYLGLGKVFPANMTGNTVLLAIGTTSGDYSAAIRSLLALGGFVLGAMLVGLTTGTGPIQIRSRRLGAVLAVECATQLAVLGWWLTRADAPTGSARLALIGMLGATMGAQSAAIARLPVGVSTTYITGTWTAVSTRAAARLRHSTEAAEAPADQTSAQAQVQIPVLACYFGAALGAGYLYQRIGGAVAAIPAVAIALVCNARGNLEPPATEQIPVAATPPTTGRAR
jgi:uncharacterized membrane protein YoaK (UPF0700 family)